MCPNLTCPCIHQLVIWFVQFMARGILEVSLPMSKFQVDPTKKWTSNLVSQKKYTKLTKRILKLIMSINNMELFLDSTQSSLNFESSFVGIYQVLKEIQLIEHEFQTRNF